MAQTVEHVQLQEAVAEMAGFRGEFVEPGHPDYEQRRRVWNGSIDRRPALIARCAGVADVIDAVKLGRRTGAQVAVRSGAHSFPGHSVVDDGLVIDLSLMKGIRVDPEARTVRVQAGALLGDLDRETQAFGYAVPAGIVTHTGVAGLTLGGGIGWLHRKLGLTIDQLRAVDLVTADGQFIKASDDENADLFWGLRGGGGNFGIVTEFEFALNPVGPQVLGGPIVWPMAKSPEVLRFYREWIKDVPDDLTTIVIHRKVPPMPNFPAEMHGMPIVMVVPCYAGPIEEGEKVLEPMRKFGTPALDMCTPKPFVAHQAMLDPGFPHGRWYYFRSSNLETLSDPVIDIIAEHAQRMTSPLNAFPIFHLGGAIARVDEDATAYSGRSDGHTINVNATTETSEGFDEQKEWSRGLWSALEPYHRAAYSNFLMEEGDERVRQAYTGPKWEKLKALKKKYDPDNFFRLNQNIPPD